MNERNFHLFFIISLILKALNGLLEIIGGILLLLISPSQISHILKIIFGEELIEDPKDFIANYLINASGKFSLNAEIYSAIYLLVHGIIKIGLVYALLKKWLWAYPLSIGIFTLFLIAQLYILFIKFSVYFVILSIFDVIVIILIWIEYKSVKKSIK